MLNSLKASNISISIKPLYSLVYMLTYNTDNLTLIIDDNSSVHDIDLKLNQVNKIKSSDLMIILSKSSELSLYNVMTNKSKIIILDELLNDMLYNIDNTSFSYNNTNKAIKDYHFWLDIQKSKIMLQRLANILIQKNPHYKYKYQQNLNDALKQLDLLDIELKKLLKTNIKNFMTYHNGWQYFILYYKLTSKGNIVINSQSHHDLDTQLSIKTLLQLKDYIVKNNVKCIFSDTQFRDSALKAFIKKEGLSSFILDEIGENLEINKDLYANMMKKNIEEINKCI
jgi:zinc transport system substrate-binding protein